MTRRTAATLGEGGSEAGRGAARVGETGAVPRSNRPRRDGRRDQRRPAGGEPRNLESALSGMQRIESHPDGDWIVRAVAPASASKAYRCPGCQQEVPAHTGHVVVWSADAI